MKFGKNLKGSVYPPWKVNYLDYDKLKVMLREDDGDKTQEWTEKDEAAFVEELLNVQLEKVNSFQAEMYKKLDERAAECESQLEKVALRVNETDKTDAAISVGDRAVLEDVLTKLDSISKELSELEKFCRLNFTGAIKAAKKHDRRRGTNYRIRPILQVRLASLPFNSEDYSPLLYRISSMYSFIRQRLEGVAKRTSSLSEPHLTDDKYTSYKFFVHPDNLLEIKTYILRHLPVLIYTPSNRKLADSLQEDPTITSLYFDNFNFSLYGSKVDKGKESSSLRIRWFGQLADNPELVLEQKTIHEGDASEEVRFPIKQKYVMPFVKGDYHMERSVRKIRDRKGEEDTDANRLEENATKIQNFIKESNLQPVVRANYTRTAYQIPGEDRVRISLDTNLVLIREDALDSDRPIRDPDSWHREDIDEQRLSFPFQSIRKGEISRFPYSVLEIKVRTGLKKKQINWLEELMSSHLVKEASRFSKFAYGVASLFEDYVNIFPFWMSLMETDIRKDPDEAFREEQDKKAKKAADEFAVGSLLGASAPKSSSFRKAVSSPMSKAKLSASVKAAESASKSFSQMSQAQRSIGRESKSDGEDEDADEDEDEPSGLRAFLPTLSTSKYAKAKRQQAELPPGVQKPTTWIKDAGPVKVEPKVWLANQRTFVKWAHIAVLLSVFSLSLYNGAGEENTVGRVLGVVYTIIAAFTAVWGWWIFIKRSRMIEQRSGKDFDNVLGPVVVCISLMIALCVNFAFQYDRRNKERQTDALVHQMEQLHREL